NRGGTPLVEIVTGPDLHSADEAKRFLQLLRQTVVELGLSDAELEKGSMRFDLNVSVRPAGSDELRTRTELKNMNSFNFAAKGIVTGGLDRLWEATVAAGAADAEAANVIANPFVATGIDPESVNPAELAKLVRARADIPRAAFDDALAHCGDPGFRAETYLAETAIP